MDKNEPMRVLFVGYGTTGTTFLTRLIDGLAIRGVHVTISGPDRKVVDNFPKGMVDWLWMPSWHGFGFLRMFHLPLLLIKALPSKRKPWLRKLIHNKGSSIDKLKTLYQYLPFARGEWDVIYFPWNSSAIDYLGLFDLGIPVVISCRGSQINIRPHLRGQECYVELLSQTLDRASAVHCVSGDILSNAVRLGLDPAKAVVIRPAVDPVFFHPAEKPKRSAQIDLITTGSLIWNKGYEYLLMSIRLMKNKGTTANLHIIGEGAERSRILFTAVDLGIASQVMMHGKLPQAEVKQRLEKADVFVLSSLSEGISNAVLEAMSCGLPVVTTDCGGMREAVRDSIEGFVVPVRDPDGMAAALHKLAQSPELRNKMGRAGRERVLSAFNSQAQIDAFVNLFESVRVCESN